MIGVVLLLVLYYSFIHGFLFSQGNMGLGFQGEKGEKVSEISFIMERAWNNTPDYYYFIMEMARF